MIQTQWMALADPTRRSALDLLRRGPTSVGAIADALAITQPTASKHLKVLRDVGLVDVTRDGQRIMYRTNPEPLRTVHDWSGLFAQYWRGQLRRIKAHAEGKR